MVRLSNFEAVRYRGIDGLSLPLSKANLITGANGVGKTALIEAIWLFTGRYNPGLLWNNNVQRFASPILDPIPRLTDGERLEFRGKENGTSRKVGFAFEKMEGASPNGETGGTTQADPRVLPPVVGRIHTYLDNKLVNKGDEGITITSVGTVLHRSPQRSTEHYNCVIETTRFQHETPGEYLTRFSNLVREDGKKELMKAIDLVAQGIEDVEMLIDDIGGPYLSVTISGARPRPLHDLGGGAVRLFRLLLGFYASRGAILLSDEMENGIHHSAQRKVWDAARQWMDQWNVQFVATTHSGELIDAAIDAFADAPSDLAIHKLFRNEKTGQIEVSTFTGETLKGARDLNLEVR